MMVFSWVDKDRRYFIAPIESLEEGQAILRQIWRQVNTYMNAEDHMVDLDIPQPLSVEIYYSIYSDIHRPNQRYRCDDLKLGKKLGNHDWDHRVNMSIFGVSVVDTYNVESQSLEYEDNSHEFLCDLD